MFRARPISYAIGQTSIECTYQNALDSFVCFENSGGLVAIGHNPIFNTWLPLTSLFPMAIVSTIET